MYLYTVAMTVDIDEVLCGTYQVAEQTGCHGDLLEDDIAPCLRTKSLSELLSVKIDPPRFLPGFAPFVDGTVLLNPSQVIVKQRKIQYNHGRESPIDEIPYALCVVYV